jgi:predicted nucleic acid-binding protein
MAQNSRYFFGDAVEVDAKAAAKHLTDEAKALLAELRVTFGSLPQWSAAAIHTALRRSRRLVRLG